MRLILVLALATLVTSAPQGDPSTTTVPPVAILKQINKINVDGSYTYGFEAEDGTFRVETRDQFGNVRGKYGYLDETGELKQVEYSAGNGTGFNPAAKHLPVAPSPLVPAQLPVQAAPAVPVAQVRNVLPAAPVVAAPRFPSVLPLAPAAVPTGNFNDEFGTDEDFQSVDADEDGQPDPPRARFPVAAPAPVAVTAPIAVQVPSAALPASTQRLQEPAVQVFPQFQQIQNVPVNFFPQQQQQQQVVQQVGNARFVNFQPVQPQQFQGLPLFNPAFFQQVPQGQQ